MTAASLCSSHRSIGFVRGGIPRPTYARHDEQGLTLDGKWLHRESIAERSRLHDWRTARDRYPAMTAAAAAPLAHAAIRLREEFLSTATWRSQGIGTSSAFAP